LNELSSIKGVRILSCGGGVWGGWGGGEGGE